MNSNADFNKIAELDLVPVKVKLMHESGEGWTPEQADAVELEYRRFLYLMMKFPHEQTSPGHDVDIFWHYHILDTAKYAADCQRAFGYFVHHYPYLGMGGDSPLKELQAAGERMRQLYEQTFGASYNDGTAAQPAMGAYCSTTDTPPWASASCNDGTAAQPATGAFCSTIAPDHPWTGASYSDGASPHRARAAFCSCNVTPPWAATSYSDAAHQAMAADGGRVTLT